MSKKSADTRSVATSSPSESPAPTIRKKPKKLVKTATQPAPAQRPVPSSADSLSTDTADLSRALEPVAAPVAAVSSEQPVQQVTGLTEQLPALGQGPSGRRKIPHHMARKEDEVADKKDEKSSLRIKVELDLEVEVELWARVKGDVTIGLL